MQWIDVLPPRSKRLVSKSSRKDKLGAQLNEPRDPKDLHMYLVVLGFSLLGW